MHNTLTLYQRTQLQAVPQYAGNNLWAAPHDLDPQLHVTFGTDHRERHDLADHTRCVAEDGELSGKLVVLNGDVAKFSNQPF